MAGIEVKYVSQLLSGITEVGLTGDIVFENLRIDDWNLFLEFFKKNYSLSEFKHLTFMDRIVPEDFIELGGFGFFFLPQRNFFFQCTFEGISTLELNFHVNMADFKVSKPIPSNRIRKLAIELLDFSVSLSKELDKDFNIQVEGNYSNRLVYLCKSENYKILGTI